MRSLLHLLAVILFIFGGLSAYGWLLSTNVAHAVGFACFGLAAWAASSFTPPANLT